MGDDQIKVQHQQKEQVREHQQIVEYSHCFATVEMVQNCFVEVRVLTQMFYTEQARVVAEETGYKYHQKAQQSAPVHCQDGQDQDQTADHAIDHGDHHDVLVHYTI